MFQQAAVTVLVNNFVKEATPHLGEHGFSLLLDFTLADGRQGQALLDTGRSGDVLVKNLADLGQNLDRLLAVILSHGHHDHTGGLPKLLERLGRRVLVVAHPGIWGMRLYDQPALHAVGVPFPRAAAEALGAEFCLAADPVRLEPGLLTTGEIPRREPLEEPVGFHRAVDGVYQAEQVTDDLSLVLDLGEEEGLFLLTGCCHAGLVNTLAHARRSPAAARSRACWAGCTSREPRRSGWS